MSSALASMPRFSSAPRLEGPSRKSHYRRSTTTKAPRKRTFIASMQKRSAASLAQSNSSESASAKWSASNCIAGFCKPRMQAIQAKATTGGNGGGAIPPNKRFGGDGGPGEGPEGMPQPALLGAAAILFAAALLVAPLASSAAVLPVARKAPKALRMRGSTLIIPHAGVAMPIVGGAIMYGCIGMTADERRCMSDAQMRFREAMHVK